MQEVKMFKAFDGKLFDMMSDAVAYEEKHRPPYWGVVGLTEEAAKLAWEDPNGVGSAVAQMIITTGYALAAIRRKQTTAKGFDVEATGADSIDADA